MQTLGQRVKALRMEKRLTQEELASEISLNKGSISAIENRSSASLDTIDALAKFFKVDRNWLQTGEGKEPKGIVAIPNKPDSNNPWEAALVKQLKEENERLWNVVLNLSGGKPANFLPAPSVVRVPMGKVVQMYAQQPGAQLGVRA